MDTLRSWLDQYDYFIMFFTLMTELIILALPGELLMSYAGFLVSEGKINWLLSILVAGLGSSIGITFTYLIGFHYGAPILKKYGHRVHLGPDKFEKASHWSANLDIYLYHNRKVLRPEVGGVSCFCQEISTHRWYHNSYHYDSNLPH